MSLSAGARLGPYEIIALLGAGGMGEVYRARDTRLDRDIAIKILPQAFVADTERVARFLREAKVLASLNHPHIAAIYGLEDADDLKGLVMELVEGEDLAQALAHGAIPLDEALRIAKQIAEALEAAHDQGIIHRDLKPANVKVCADGTVKVLDFGLAKAKESSVRSEQSVAISPTITSPAITGVGVLLGTAVYMSPEQARGKPADKRSDVWAFGCVLYEMLTGIRPFDGEDVSDTLAAVLRDEPVWHALPRDTPASIRVLLRGCLEKDRNKRIADLSTARFVIDAPDVLPTPGSSGLRRFVLWAGVLALVVAGALAISPVERDRSIVATRPGREVHRTAATRAEFRCGARLACHCDIAGRQTSGVRGERPLVSALAFRPDLETDCGNGGRSREPGVLTRWSVHRFLHNDRARRVCECVTERRDQTRSTRRRHSTHRL